ncbi:MAG: hypothetical protein JXK07_11475 [Spirochaetes bacterium]|nr:hypothetical protein [Spirochaetota bacterium]MBN2770846.1 hypothetical protein [Spirochaetota bacterium]
MRSRENRNQYWQEHLKAYYTSGLSQKEYCRQEDIGYWSFNQWKRRIEGQSKTNLTEIKLPVPIQPSHQVMTLKYREELTITLPLSVSGKTLREILAVLGEMQ